MSSPPSQSPEEFGRALDRWLEDEQRHQDELHTHVTIDAPVEAEDPSPLWCEGGVCFIILLTVLLVFLLLVSIITVASSTNGGTFWMFDARNPHHTVRILNPGGISTWFGEGDQCRIDMRAPLTQVGRFEGQTVLSYTRPQQGWSVSRLGLQFLAHCPTGTLFVMDPAAVQAWRVQWDDQQKQKQARAQALRELLEAAKRLRSSP